MYSLAVNKSLVKHISRMHHENMHTTV